LQTIKLPWQSWYSDSVFSLNFPNDWEVETFSLASPKPPLDIREVEDKVLSEEALKLLDQLSPSVQSVVIAVDDLTRPTPAYRILPILLKAIEKRGVSSSSIKIIIGLGTHRPLSKKEISMKVGGAVADEYDIVNHNCRENLVSVKVGNQELEFNEEFLKADFKISIGTVLPHPLCGFSGGANMIYPGLASVNSTSKIHRLAFLTTPPGQLEGNRIRKNIDRVAETIGLDLVINTIGKSHQEIHDVFSGELFSVFKQGTEVAKRFYSVETHGNDYDAIVLNTYPKDSELVQSENAFNYFRTMRPGFLKDEGVVILATSCPKGVGIHGLFQKGAPLYKTPAPKAFLRGRHLVVFSPNIKRGEFEDYFWMGYSFCNRWEEVLTILKEKIPVVCPKVAVFPTASIQIEKRD